MYDYEAAFLVGIGGQIWFHGVFSCKNIAMIGDGWRRERTGSVVLYNFVSWEMDEGMKSIWRFTTSSLFWLWLGQNMHHYSSNPVFLSCCDIAPRLRPLLSGSKAQSIGGASCYQEMMSKDVGSKRRVTRQDSEIDVKWEKKNSRTKRDQAAKFTISGVKIAL